jgi:T1SS-143 domain-containing protein
VATDEDHPVNGQVKATDLDGDSLTFSKGSDPAHGSVTVKPDGSWTYTPGANETSAVSFTIVVSDGKGGTATSTINVGINPLNDPPKFDDPENPSYDPVTGNYSVTTDEDQPVNGQVKATDLDGDALTFSKGSDPAHGSVTVKPDGSWTYTPGANETSPVSFTIVVSDGKGGTATSTINVGINPLNDPPKFDDPENPSYDPVTGNYSVTTDEDQPVNGQVKATDLDGDALTFSKGSDPAHGSVTVKPDGSWTYTPQSNFNGADQFTITVSDGKGSTATSTIRIGVTPINDAPILSAGPGASISEEGLVGGHADTDGNTDTTNARQASGQVNFSDIEGQVVSLGLSGPTGLTSGGVSITWSGQGTASSPLIGTAAGKTVFTATIGADGRYQVELHAPIDHADPTREDARTIDLQVSATDGQKTSSATLAIRIEDDAPLSGAQVVEVQGQAATQNTNLMLILDTSGSMKDRLADMTVNGLKAAIKTLIDRYDGLGDVQIQIVTFGSGAQGQSTWLSVNDAKALINTLTANGGTNYDAALAAARTAFNASGKIAGGVNVSYFITDGVPTNGQGVTDGNDEANWETFLKANDIDSYAIGTGSLTSSQIGNIQPIAYNGITETEKPAVTLATNTELGNYLLDTVPVIQKGSLAVLAGADGLKSIDSVSAVGQLGSSLDASGKVLTLQLKSGGTLQVNLQTGEFTLSQPKGAVAESFSYSVIDRDGDRGTGTFTLSATNVAPQGADTSVTLAEDSRHTFSAADFGFQDGDLGDTLGAVRIDALPSAGQLTLNGAPVAAGQVIQAGALAQLNFQPAANAHGNAYASLSFTVQDSRGQFDGTPNKLVFHVTPVNDAPEAFASDSGHNLLGLVDLSVNPLLNLSKTQQVAVNDIDNNLVRVEVRVDALLSLGSLLGDRSALTVATDAALTQGLLITGNDSRHLVIESIHPGQTLDVTQVNKLLATLQYDPADILGVSADLFPSMTITATDAAGARDSACVSSSIVAVGVDVTPVVHAVETVVSGVGEHAAQLGTEVFQWTLADRPATGDHCVDVIHGFDGAARSAGGDVLDLRDLLSGEQASSLNGQIDVGNLLSHLDFDTQSQPGSTVIHVSASGGFQADASGNSASAGCQDQQQIVLSNVDIRASLGLDAQASDHQIIAELMQRGKLLVDNS